MKTPDPNPAARPLRISSRFTLPNRLCILPLEGCDADAYGAPGPLTLRRYNRFAAGGAGLVWMEALAVEDEGRSNPAQLRLRPRNVRSFATLLEQMRRIAQDRHGHDLIILAQLSHAGPHARPDGKPHPAPEACDPIGSRISLLDTDDHARIRRAFREAAGLARQAGFDGVDIACCQGNLLDEDANPARHRSGRNGVSDGARARRLREIVADAIDAFPEGLTAVRLTIPPTAETVPDEIPADFSAWMNDLRLAGVDLFSPWFPTINEPQSPHPSTIVHDCFRRLRAACPSLTLVAGGFSARAGSQLGSWITQILNTTEADLVGLGRAALANPELARALLQSTEPDVRLECADCGGCEDLLRWGGPVGCVLRDADTYGAIYRGRRASHPDPLREAATDCRSCRAPDCRAACPANLDVPSMVRAFTDGAWHHAYSIARASHPLPGITAWLCPTWLQCEGSCIQSRLRETSVPVRDIQRAIVHEARHRGWIGMRLPAEATHRRICIVGGGPTGLAAATLLLEAGHSVRILERSHKLGGMPAHAIPASRFPDDALREIDALLDPAIAAGRLQIAFGSELGHQEHLEQLCACYDAVLLATGLWREQSSDADAEALDALEFLCRTKSGDAPPPSQTAALLCGGDCAMDAAVTLRQQGVLHLFLLYEGDLATMHWHLPDTWLRSPGVHVHPLTRLVQSRSHPESPGVELTLESMSSTDADANGCAVPLPHPCRYSLSVGQLIRARGLVPDPVFQSELDRFPGGSPVPQTGGIPGLIQTRIPSLFAAGALVNGGASVVQCMRDGMNAAQAIHDRLRR